MKICVHRGTERLVRQIRSDTKMSLQGLGADMVLQARQLLQSVAREVHKSPVQRSYNDRVADTVGSNSNPTAPSRVIWVTRACPQAEGKETASPHT